MKRMTISLFAAFAAGALFAAPPEVTAVTVSQDAQRVVTVGYSLSTPALVTVDFLTNGVSLISMDAKLTGDIGWVATAGSNKRVQWRPRKSLPAGLEIRDVTVRVLAYSAARQPDYMVVDPATGWRQFYATSNDVPGGVLANADYRGKYLLLRRIPAAWKEQMLGKPNANWGGNTSRRTRHAVMLTQDYYMTVFPVTRGQLAQAYGWTQPTDDPYTGQSNKTSNWRLRPAEGMGYDDIRGGETDDKIDWPTTGDAVAEGSILGKFRDNTGILFDLPTDAQYEIACRAGCDADITTGYLAYEDDGSNAVKRTGWYAENSMEDTVSVPGATSANFTHIVGLKEPNGYGLYDMCGNVRQLCRDWWMEQPGTANETTGYEPSYYDPKGPTKDQSEQVSSVYRRVSHSGHYNEARDLMQTSVRNPETPGKKGKGAGSPYIGFRMVCPALYGGTILE